MAIATGTALALAAGASAAGSIYTAKKGSSAAKSAARSQENAAREGIDEQRRQFDTFQDNIQPYLGIGSQATGSLGQLLSGDMTGFQQDPGYQFRMDQGLKALDRSAASRGSLFSGGTDLDRIQFGQGVGAQEYGNYWSRLMDTARLGQNSAVGAGHMGMGMASNIGNLLGNIGQAQGNSAINQANAWGGGLQGVTGALGTYLGARQSSYQPTPFAAPNWGASGGFGSNWGSGMLGPSNGSTWNFGGGG